MTTARMRVGGHSSRTLAVALGVVFALLGLVLAAIETFLHPARFAGVPVGVIGAGVANALVATLAGRGSRSRLFAAIPGLFWLVGTIVLTASRPEGDLVIEATWLGWTYLLAGALGTIVGIGFTPPYRRGARPVSWPKERDRPYDATR